MSDADHEHAPEIPASGHDRGMFASASLPTHLARGAIGFGLLGAAVALAPSHGPAALLLAPPGMVALRGCPTCWTAGLVETISAGRLQRTCTESGCALVPTAAAEGTRGARTDAATVEATGGTRTVGIPRGRTKATRSRAA
jgi:hypothetical protein